MREGGDPLAPYHPQQNSPTHQRRASEELLPASYMDSGTRKRNCSTSPSSRDILSPLRQVRPQGWQESPQAASHLTPSYLSSQQPAPPHHSFRESNNPSNDLYQADPWKNPPQAHRPSSSFDSMAHFKPGSSDYAVDWDDRMIDA